jgi:poly-gamma-glutamate capsule biosynthesis protein CapA/YwtB (metallophosphatase superfamily)
VLRKAGLDTVGTYKAGDNTPKPVIKDIRGVKVGYIAYSYGTNGIPVPEEHLQFNFLDREVILQDIAELREQVDVIVLVLHWG